MMRGFRHQPKGQLYFDWIFRLYEGGIKIQAFCLILHKGTLQKTNPDILTNSFDVFGAINVLIELCVVLAGVSFHFFFLLGSNSEHRDEDFVL